MSEFLPKKSEGIIDLSEVAAIIRRQRRVVLICGLVALILGTAYAFVVTPRYTATTTLFIDSNNERIATQLLASDDRGQPVVTKDDDAIVLTQVEILKSDRIVGNVVDKLDLLHDPDFIGKPSLIAPVIAQVKQFIKSFISDDEKAPDSLEVQRQNAIDTVQKFLNVARVGRTFVMQVDYSSTSPTLASNIANAVVNAYLEDEFQSKFDATRRAGDWLQTRIEDLRQRSLESDRAVQRFRAEKGLISSSGELVSDQQLTQINSKLAEARNQTADAKAKLDSIQQIVDKHEVSAAVTASLDNPVLTKLQQEYLDTSRRQSEIASRYGANHLQAVRLRDQMAEYERVMFEELGRMASAYRSAYEVALSRQTGLEQEVQQSTERSVLANDDLVQLRELERTADTYKKLYETYLQRFQEATQRESFPVTEARVVTPADVPQKPSYPKKPLFMLLSLVAGLGIGGVIGTYREFGERFFRTGEQVRDTLDVEFLGQVPLLPAAGRGKVLAPPVPGQISTQTGIERYVVEHPFSAFAETARNARFAADFVTGRKSGKIIGIVSVLPQEGKTTTAINFAQYLAKQGARTILIDADLRNPGATRYIGRSARAGLYEVLGNAEPLDAVILSDPETRLDFLPAVIKQRIPFSAELLSSEPMSELLTRLSQAYDYVVLDLPPLGPVVDARAISSKIDCFLMVIEWGRTTRSLVRTALSTNPAIVRKCAGVILSKVDTSKIDLYVREDQSFFQNRRYDEYYIEKT